MKPICLSIIIVSYNTKEVTRNCLASIYQNPPECPFEIIVVDNNSSDGSPETIEREFSEVVLMKNLDNAGFARANNKGIEISSGRYLLLLNPDTLVLPDALNRMISFMDRKPDAGAITPRIWLDEERTFQSHILHPFTMGHFILGQTPIKRLFPQEWVFKRIWDKDIEVWLSKVPVEIDCFAGACMMLRREVIESVGVLDESFFMFFEDNDWCLRIKKAGWNLFLLNDAEIIHLVNQSPSDRRMELYWSSLAYYLRKHYHWTTRAFLKICFLLSKALAKFFLYLNILSQENTVTAEPLTYDGLRWPEVASAQGYLVEIAMEPTFMNKGCSMPKHNWYTISPGLLRRWPDGFYYWRVAPIYTKGAVGEFSEPKAVRKIRNSL